MLYTIMRFTGEEKLYFMRTMFMDLFMSTFLVGSLLYFIETVRPGAVSRFIPLSFFLCLTLAAALLAFLLTGEVEKK
ncbi:MAG: hypothetical protein Q7T25_11995, partial [Sideroxyarcus sp.]|nr:hypothetical protein [Sideroxyarcus sp.]